MRETLLTLALLALGGSSAPDEKFLPPRGFAGSKLVLCAVGGNADKTSDAFNVVQYAPEGEFRTLISKRTDVVLSLEDCSKWFHDAAEAAKKEIRK